MCRLVTAERRAAARRLDSFLGGGKQIIQEAATVIKTTSVFPRGVFTIKSEDTMFHKTFNCAR